MDDVEDDLDEIDAIVIDDVDEEGSDASVPADIASSVPELPDTYGVDGIMSVPIEVVVSVGKAQPLVKDFLAMTRDSLLVLDSKIDDPVEIRVAGRTIARGELQEVPDKEGMLAVRLTEIVTRGDD
ncbi:MAG: FliM/FliN family flagellar motor switch protein [Pseudomonadota bacterium]